jgi:hypothetical protein
METTMRYSLCLVLTLAACASSNLQEKSTATTTVRSAVAPKQAMDITRETTVTTTYFEASRERVWNALLAAHEAIGIPLSSGDAASGRAIFELTNQIRTVASKPASRYVDCGIGSAGARADSYRLTVRLTHTLQATTSGGTALLISMQAWARNPALSSDPVPCSSRGVLETEISGMVTTRLQ